MIGLHYRIAKFKRIHVELNFASKLRYFSNDLTKKTTINGEINSIFHTNKSASEIRSELKKLISNSQNNLIFPDIVRILDLFSKKKDMFPIRNKESIKIMV